MADSRKISALSDEEELDLYIKSGDNKYFGSLYNRYIPLLYGVCLKYLRNPDKAQDAVMQLFEILLPKIEQYDIKVFRTWIYSVMKNHCLQILRKEKIEILIDYEVNVMEKDEILHLFEESEDDQIAELNDCMDKLPEQQRISVVSFFMDDMSYADIAESSGYNLNQVKSYIQNGKRNLKNCMEKKK